MARKSFDEKLNQSKNMPKVTELTDPSAIARYGGTMMLIAPPLAYDEVMREVPHGQVTTVEHIRRHLARKHDADFTCPLTAGIFINIVAHAAAERGIDVTPYWRTLRRDGELNEKYPDGIDGHKALLETEGHEVIQRGKRYFVRDYKERLYQPE